MPTFAEFQNRRGTALATFTQGGTYSSVVTMGGMALIGVYSPNYPAAAGSLTFRASGVSGNGYPVHSEASVVYRVNPFGSGTYYALTAGSALRVPYLVVEVPAGGTPGVAAGGTIVLVGEA